MERNNATSGDSTSQPSLQSAHSLSEREMVLTVWTDGEERLYPYVWLRDSCPCPSCWHPSQARILRMQELQVDVQPTDVKVDDGALAISWSDGHTSSFPSDWLLLRQFTPQAIQQRISADVIKPKLWGTELQGKIPSVTFHELMTDTEARYRWHVGLEELGLYLVTGAPEEKALQKLAQRVAFLRTTNYGTEFIVQSKVDPVSLAYTAGTLGFHTDLSYYNYVPGVQMLHCVVQTKAEGGDNNFADGFHVARQMSVECPDHYEALTRLALDRADIGRETYDYHIKSRKPIIGLSKEGEVCQIDYSNHIRESALNIPLEEVIPLFRAMKDYDDRLYNNQITYKLKPGEIICFDNQRVLHGRAGYQLEAGGERKLVGGYIDWDEMRSGRRVLQHELQKS